MTVQSFAENLRVFSVLRKEHLKIRHNFAPKFNNIVMIEERISIKNYAKSQYRNGVPLDFY